MLKLYEENYKTTLQKDCKVALNKWKYISYSSIRLNIIKIKHSPKLIYKPNLKIQ